MRLATSTVHVAPPSRLPSILTLSCVPRLCDQVMFFGVPMPHATFVFGAVTVPVGAATVNTTLLRSPLSGGAAGLSRISPDVVSSDAIWVVSEPVVDVAAGTPEAIGIQLEPLSGLRSTSKVWAAPRLCVQVMLRVDPAAHVTAVFGAVTVMSDVTLKFTSLTSCTAPFFVHEMRIRAAVVPGPVTIQVWLPDVLPELARLSAMTDQVAPALRLSWILTFSSVPRLCDQVMLLLDPIVQLTLVFGAVTVTVGVASVTRPSLESLSDVSVDQLTRTSPCVVTTDGSGAV